MKKILVAITLAMAVISCRGKEENKNILYVYGWANTIPQTIYDDFERETGIKVVEDIYSSNEEMFTKLKAGGDGYDIVMPSADYVEIMMKEGMIEKLDKTKLPNYNNLDPLVLEKLHHFDPKNDYEVPYLIGATIIAVNKKYVSEYPKDYSIYEMNNLRGRMTLLDDMREVMTSALGMLGYPQTVSDEKIIAQAAELVKTWKRNIAKFDSESFGKGFASGDFWVVQGYPDNIFKELDEKDRANVEMIIPEKGGTAYVDSFVLLQTAANKENAYKFLEYTLRAEVAAKIADALETPSVNLQARELMKIKPLFEISDLKNIQVLRDINTTLDLQNKYWQEILIAE
ncbi:Spermidine/putrescine-binding periplasmic protein precursor [Fusobacterium necrogenes]|uniref:Spermidine/putrescine-binding periplasmic protein n=1 Tax=Fusobacterium necrogenes TaxID=858 RepID=A0A377GWR5_9FUSO|nr:extracellular solute-binding protein [Fusobacterium necrogenes]STO31054.1 Spermidine/putrescine-binding periplasmic protein precursor [Fusobacterium necrogenes]